MKSTVSALVACVALSACGGSSTGGGAGVASGFFVAGLEGSVFIDGALRSVDDGAVFGIFQGSNADVASGLIGATGVTSGSSDISIEGVVIVER